MLFLKMFVVTINAQNLEYSLTNILQSIQNNIELQKEQIINIFSKEEITVKEYDKNIKPVITTNIISNYRIFPVKDSIITDCQIVFQIISSMQPSIMLEDREILSIKRNNKNIKDFTEDIWAKGNNYTDIFIIFDKQNEKCFDYKLLDIENIDGRKVLAIEIKQKKMDFGKNDLDNVVKNNSDMKMISISWNLTYEGIILVDAETMEIVQLYRDGIEYIETHKYNNKPPLNNAKDNWIIFKEEKYYFFINYKYEKIMIGGHNYTLPTNKTVKLFRENGQLDTVYEYRYSNYGAFSTDAKVMFDVIEE